MIYINGRFLTQPMTGVERYAYNMCKAMAEQHQPVILICPHAPIQACYDVSGLQIVHYGRGNSHFWEQCILPFFFIGKKNYVVVSFTGLGSILIRHKIMTIHDLSFLENPKWFSKGYYWWYKLMTPLAVRTSKHIITVSHFSKKEILKFYPFLKDQDISVIYCASDESRFHVLSQVPPSEERFALAVSSLDPRKNFSRLIDAFKDIKDCKLYIVGSYNPAFSQQNSQSTQQNNICFLGRVSDEELLRLYNQASCFIFPSVYEGFGIPPIEAMCCGCPVLASDIPVIREVCGDAALYFNPNSAQDIQQTIQRFLTDDTGMRTSLIEKGHQNKDKFSWTKTAQSVTQLVQQYK